MVYLKGDYDYITIYNIEGQYATKLMIYRGDNKLIWDILNIPLDINNLDVNSLLNLPTHINLIDECCNDDYYNNIDDPYDIIDDFEPLHGWDNLLERSSDTERIR